MTHSYATSGALYISAVAKATTTLQVELTNKQFSAIIPEF